MKDLIIHFGIHRTGTTTTQAFLKKNKGILRSHGVLYPSLYGLPDHVKIPWWIQNKKISIDDLIDKIKSQDEEIIDKIIISAEDFCLLDDFSFLDEFKKHFNVKVVIYLKDQISWLESWYNQHIKWPWVKKFSACTPDYFIENLDDFPWIDYSILLSRLSTHLPAGDLSVKRVGKNGVLDTTSDFIQFLDMEVDRFHKYQHANESLSAISLEIVRRIDLYDMPPKSRTKILTAVRSIDNSDKSKYVFTYDQCCHIKDRYLKSNRQVASKYFNDGELFLDNPKRQEPTKLSDNEVYTLYLPKLIKKLSEE